MGAGVYPFAPLAAGCHSCSHPAARPWALGPSRGAVVLGRCGHATGLRSGAPPYGIFPLQPALPISLKDVFFDCEAHNSEIRASLKPGPHDEFLLSQSVAEAEAGFCTPPLTWSQLLRETQGKPIRLIPRCVIQQSSGKQRIIDTLIPEVSLPSARNLTSWSSARLCGRPSMLYWLSPPSASTGPRRSSSATAWKAGEKIGRMPTGRVQCRRTNLGPASSVGIIVSGGFLRTSCTQGSSLACPWLSRLSTGIPDSVKPWDAVPPCFPLF